MDVHAIDSGAVAVATAAPQATVPGSLPDPIQKAIQAQDPTLHQALSQLMGGSNVAVSFRVIKGTGEIVTVFKDTETGQVITQFPPESMVLIAQFFNKLAGAVLDRTA